MIGEVSNISTVTLRQDIGASPTALDLEAHPTIRMQSPGLGEVQAFGPFLKAPFGLKLRVRPSSHSLLARAPVAFFGGRFAPHKPEQLSPWRRWPNFEWWIPTWILYRDATGEQSWIHQHIVEQNFHGHPAALDSSQPPAPLSSSVSKRDALCMTQKQWRQWIQTILEQLNPAFPKIVAARQEKRAVNASLHTETLYRTLFDNHTTKSQQHGLRFAWNRGQNDLFVGHTPETLFALEGSSFWTEALAGTFASHIKASEQSDEQLAKLTREHYWVRHFLQERLQSMVGALHFADPQALSLNALQHMRSTVQAQLHPSSAQKPCGSSRVEAFLQALHPTPAVAGYPQAQAQQWLAEHEPWDRGWYSGPIGWVCANGDAHAWVSLRCMLLQEAQAWLFAGAGIVEGSEPQAEWDETELKLEPMRRLLQHYPVDLKPEARFVQRIERETPDRIQPGASAAQF